MKTVTKAELITEILQLENQFPQTTKIVASVKPTRAMLDKLSLTELQARRREIEEAINRLDLRAKQGNYDKLNPQVKSYLNQEPKLKIVCQTPKVNASYKIS